MISKKIVIKIIVGVFLALIGFLAGLSETISYVFIFASYFVIGGDVLISAIKNIFRGNVFDENFLMSIATVGAFIIDEALEAIIVMLFYQIGEAFQTYTVGKSRNSITELMNIKPEFAYVKKGDDRVKVSPSEVMIDDTIIVKPGEKIPLDGVLVEGAGVVDTKALTGESLPLDVLAGDDVLSGFINMNTLLTIRVTRKYEDSTVVKILDLVENATFRKSKSEKFITKFARYYTPAVVIAAFLLGIVPPLLDMGEWYDCVYTALSFLVVSCPCALVISIPLGFFGGIGGAARKGVLIKGGNYLEVLAKTDVVIFDKTGTLTKGIFKIKNVVPKGISEDELLEIAAAVESNSNHPIALSITKNMKDKINLNDVTDVNELAGYGVSANYKGDFIYVGNAKLMDKNNIPYEKTDEIGSVLYVSKNGEYIGHILVADEVKEDSKKAIEYLKDIGIKKIIMLTGDKKESANYFASELGITDVYSELLPADKLEIAEKELSLVKEKRKLLYVGDGINDAPVLARVDVGIAMGKLGSQAAIEAADIVIMNDAPSKVVTAINISKKTLEIVKQNIALAFIVKGAVLILAVGGHSSLWEVIFADVGVAVLAILNAMRAMNFKERD